MCCSISTPLYSFSSTFMADLHYGDYRSKIVHFESQKNIFYVLKRPSLEQFSP